MRRIGEYAAGTRAKVAMVLGLAAFLAAVMVATQIKPAGAWHNDPCKDTQITQIVTGITGQAPRAYACYHQTYDANLKPTDSYSTKQSKNTPVINACGTTTTQRYIAQAVVEITGNKPVATAPSGVCSQALYEQNVRDIYGNSTTVDWTVYRTNTYPEKNAFEAVNLALTKCGITDISQAIMEVTGQLPKDGKELEDPGSLGSEYFRTKGQCESTLYHNGAAAYNGYEAVKDAVRARAQSTKQCENPWITEAYVRMTGWNPLPQRLGDGLNANVDEECDGERYGGGIVANFEELKGYVYQSWRCENPWIGQVYAKYHGRKAYGVDTASECKPHLYGDVNNGNLGIYPFTWQEMQKRVAGTRTTLTNAGWSFRQSGSGDMVSPSGQITSADIVKIASPNGVIATGGLNVIASGGGNIIGHAGGTFKITTPHGSVIATGGGNVIATGGGNLAPKGGNNILSTYGGG